MNEILKLDNNNALGRFFIAAKDIKRGELIVTEQPILTFPEWDSNPICSNCFADSYAVCKNCNVFPLCEKCTSHAGFDCNFFYNIKGQFEKNFLVNNFNIFGPLKCLLLSESEATVENFEIIMKMESHVNSRRNSDIWKYLDKKVVNPVIKSGISKHFKRTILDSEILQKICGIFDVNSFVIRNSKNNGQNLRGLYENGGLLPHDCVCNTLITLDDKYTMRIYANDFIKKGEIVYNNYTNPLLDTDERKLQLKMGKYFECSCNRCSDPTELGTFMGSILCEYCKNSLISRNSELVWKCNNCHKIVQNDNIKSLLRKIKIEILEANGDIRALEKLILKYSRILNPNHYLVVDMKQQVAAFLRTICMDEQYPPGKSVLKRKLALCQDILIVLRKIQPGISRLTGIALYECFSPMVKLAKKQLDDGDIQENEYLAKLQEAEAILKEAISMLLFEHISTPEGVLVRRAFSELKELRDVIGKIAMPL